MNTLTISELERIIAILPPASNVGDELGLCSPTNDETPEELRRAIADKEGFAAYLSALPNKAIEAQPPIIK